MRIEEAGKIAFFIDIRVSSREIGTWEPDRIERFMGGIAQAIEARGPNPPIETEERPRTLALRSAPSKIRYSLEGWEASQSTPNLLTESD